MVTFSPCSLCLRSLEIKGQKVIKINLLEGFPSRGTSMHIVWVQESSKENADLGKETLQTPISILATATLNR